MFVKAAIATLFAAFAAAQVHEPVGDTPTANFNPITRPLNEIVTAGEPFTITWTPTTTNKVSLLLLKGPSNNVVPVATIVANIENSGSYEYVFPGSFGGSSDATGYGIQIIDDVNGNYQYSTQFGIEVPEGYSSSAVPSSSKGYPTSAPSTSANSTSAYPTKTPTSSYVASTGHPVSNSSVILPSKSMTVPSSLKTTATVSGTASGSATGSSAPPQATGAAAGLRAGLGLAAGVAGLVFML